VLDHCRAASDISESATAGTTSTEDLRQAMSHYRALFHDLLGQSAGNAAAVAGQGYTPTEPGLAPVANGGVSGNWPANAEAEPTPPRTRPPPTPGP